MIDFTEPSIVASRAAAYRLLLQWLDEDTAEIDACGILSSSADTCQVPADTKAPASGVSTNEGVPGNVGLAHRPAGSL